MEDSIIKIDKINRNLLYGTMNLTFNSSTQLMGDLDLSRYNNPTPPTFNVLVKSGTPYGQITRCLVGIMGNDIFRFYVQGSGFVTGHVVQIIWYSSENI